MFHYLLMIFSLFLPINVFTSYKMYPSYNGLMISMVPSPGSFVSKEGMDNQVNSDDSLNQVFEPGCSVESTRRNRPDGTTEVRETLSCTTVRIEDDEGQTQRVKPSSNSKLNKKDQRTVSDFMSARKTGSSSKKK